MTKQIITDASLTLYLTRKSGEVIPVIIDKKDLPLVASFSWHIVESTTSRTNYVASSVKGKNIYLHRLILSPEKDQVVDHINGNGLDNRRCNLRVCTHSQNKMNKSHNRSKDGYKGVFWDKSRNKWLAYIGIGNKQYKNLGRYNNKTEAAIAYNVAALKYHGDFAKLNEVMPNE